MAKIVDRKDVRYGRLVAIDYFYKSFSTGRKYVVWRCKCDCGKEAIAGAVALTTGAKQSCGCLRIENAKKINPLSFANKHCESGKNITDIYKLYKGIKDRVKCTRKETARYYLDKGIVICDEWKINYLSFKKWAIENGYKKGLIIDRIDNSKGYAPDNCRFVTAKQSSRNTSSNRIFNFNGINMTLAEIIEKTGKNGNTVRGRIRNGASIFEAIAERFEQRQKTKVSTVA